uniref:Ubiquitin-like domain-containing protein n=1 Tax=Leersia perrieri TaxID=77586 RepID=A0A0D9X0N5_9ORYZ
MATVTVKVEKENDGKKPATKAAGEYLTLKVQDSDGRTVCRTMRRTDQLQALMDYFYDRVQDRVARGTGRFLYDGHRLRGTQTPAELKMEDGDEVDFFVEMLAMSKRSRSEISAAGGDQAESLSPEIDQPSNKLITLRVKDSEGVTITRTMRATDKLSDLIFFYLAMVQANRTARGVFMHYGRKVTVNRTPADYDMEDGDEISYFPDGTMTMPVTLTVQDGKGRRITRSMRRSYMLTTLFDLYFELLPSTAPREGVFMYNHRAIDGKQSPASLDMKDGDEITFCPIIEPSFFVTLTMKGSDDGCGSVTRTMRRTDKCRI